MVAENNYAHRYGAVGDVKGWPMIVANVNIQKINHNAQSDPIYQISDGAAEYQGKPDGQKSERRWRFFIEIKNKAHSQRGCQQKDNRAHRLGIVHIFDINPAFFDFCKILAVHRQFADCIGAEIKKANRVVRGIFGSE